VSVNATVFNGGSSDACVIDSTQITVRNGNEVPIVYGREDFTNAVATTIDPSVFAIPPNCTTVGSFEELHAAVPHPFLAAAMLDSAARV
jgi:hypothetical protein